MSEIFCPLCSKFVPARRVGDIWVVEDHQKELPLHGRDFGLHNVKLHCPFSRMIARLA